MKEMLRYGFILTFICVLASGLLAAVDLLTKSKIAAQLLEEEQLALKEVMPQGETFEPVKEKEEVEYYKVFDNTGKFCGIVFKASAKGYSSTIDTLAAMSADAKISAIKVLSQNETPGLGSKIAEPEFSVQFQGRDSSLSGVAAISGATISSRAVINSVRKKAEEIRSLIKDGK